MQEKLGEGYVRTQILSFNNDKRYHSNRRNILLEELKISIDSETSNTTCF